MTTYYCTRWALTNGIEKFEYERPENNPWHAEHWAKYVSYMRHNAAFSDSLRLGTEAFESYADALADAEKRKAKKLASLRKQLAKLEALQFPAEAK